MTKQREWPNNASDARDRSAEYAQAALRELEPIIADGPRFNYGDILLRVARAIKHLLSILRLLEGAGAKTKP